jgi:hypothetical protein
MTPREFRLYWKTWVEKEKHIDRRLAVVQANVINPWVKKRLRPADFLPKSKQEKKIALISNKEDFKKFMRERAERAARKKRRRA